MLLRLASRLLLRLHSAYWMASERHSRRLKQPLQLHSLGRMASGQQWGWGRLGLEPELEHLPQQRLAPQQCGHRRGRGERDEVLEHPWCHRRSSWPLLGHLLLLLLPELLPELLSDLHRLLLLQSVLPVLSVAQPSSLGVFLPVRAV